MGIQLSILEFIAEIVKIQYIGPIIIVLFLLSIFKIIRLLSLTLLFSYFTFVALFFTFNEFGIDTIRVYQMKKTLIPEAYTSYKQALQLSEDLMWKRWVSYYTYKNMDKLNEKFIDILKFLEEEKNNVPEISNEREETLNQI